jgi:hypothetical protein
MARPRLLRDLHEISKQADCKDTKKLEEALEELSSLNYTDLWKILLDHNGMVHDNGS